MTTTLNLKTAPGHQVLAAAGKKTLRPGGQAATDRLLAGANLQPGATVLELAASFGYSAIAIAQRYGVNVIGIDKNPDSVAQAQLNIAAAGLSDRVTIMVGDIFHLEALPQQFDYVLAEAILSMQSAPGKAAILHGIQERLKPGGYFLSHELLVTGAQAETIRRDLAHTIRSNTTPLSTAEWIAACTTANLIVTHQETGPMQLLNPRRILQEEGWGTLLRLAGTMLTRPVLRDRILQMRQVFNQYRDDLGYIVLSAQKPAA